MNVPEPEREMVRRTVPFMAPALVLTLILATALDGWFTGASAVIGVAVVILNFVAHGLSLAWAARISPTMLFAVGVGGFALRLATILILLVVLNGLDWFSAAAFVAAVVPATLLLLIYEAKLMSGRMQVDLWAPAREAKR